MADTWVIPNEGKAKILEELFRSIIGRESFILQQFTTGGPVGDASTFANFAVANYPGYMDVQIARGDWALAVAVLNVGEISKTNNPVFTCTGGQGQVINGLLLRGFTSGVIYCGDNYGTPITMSTGATDTINPLKIRSKTFV